MSSSSAESARLELVECEREIQKIKGAIRQVVARGDEGPNTLEVVWIGMDHGPDGATEADAAELSLQLSAPMEEVVIGRIRTGSSDAADDDSKPSSAKFSSVDCTMATLAVTLRVRGEVVGTSESHDLASICSFGDDALHPKEEYVTELTVTIKSDKDDAKVDEDAAADAAAKEAEDVKEGEEPTPSATTTEAKKPVCTIQLRLIFKPSARDQKEELYELLNQASVRRSQALERHKGQQEQQQQQQEQEASGKKGPAVKAGFLNTSKKSKKTSHENKVKIFYDKYLGPRSLARSLIIPIAKNYVIFFGAVILAHFKGQELALPAPV